MFESFLVQVRVRGGFPTQTQVRVTSEPISVVVGLGSTTIRGATEVEREKQIIRVLSSSGWWEGAIPILLLPCLSAPQSLPHPNPGPLKPLPLQLLTVDID